MHKTPLLSPDLTAETFLSADSKWKGQIITDLMEITTALAVKGSYPGFVVPFT